jgi:membrane-bound lytic murein transglycosylase D
MPGPSSRETERNWNRYAAPTAFLLAVTIALLLVRSALHQGDPTVVPVRPASRPAATTTAPATTGSTGSTTASAGRRTYTVVAGDTFGVIAEKTGTSVADLERLNPGTSSTSLHIGQKLRVA